MNKLRAQEAEITDEKAITIQAPQSLDKPGNDTDFAHASAKLLMDIVHKNNWAKKLGGDKAHLAYEAWQTVGKYYGYSVKTYDAEYVEYGDTWGFKAKAVVVNEVTGIEVGGAEAYCMSDESNWKSKPKFQLASMAQTRAGSKSLRQILGFVVALAGYNPTPAEEMEEPQAESAQATSFLATEKQINFIKGLLNIKGFTREQLYEKYEITDMSQLTADQASTIIGNLKNLPDKGFRSTQGKD